MYGIVRKSRRKGPGLGRRSAFKYQARALLIHEDACGGLVVFAFFQRRYRRLLSIRAQRELLLIAAYASQSCRSRPSSRRSLRRREIARQTARNQSSAGVEADNLHAACRKLLSSQQNEDVGFCALRMFKVNVPRKPFQQNELLVFLHRPYVQLVGRGRHLWASDDSGWRAGLGGLCRSKEPSVAVDGPRTDGGSIV
jgi:hypothetical protein